MRQPDQAEIERLLRGVDIPPCPAVLTRLQNECASPNASLSAIATIIGSDVALSASVLKVANSTAFGLNRKVSTVQQALPVLGMRAVSSMVAGIVLKNTLSGGDGPRMDRFWETTTQVAQLCARLTKEFRGVPADLAYTFGLFHNCGIAVLMRRFPDYKETLQLANSAEEQSFTEIEDKHHATNHAVLGYLLTRNWGLSDDICNAILLHHDIEIFTSGADATAAKARTLVSLSALAEYYVNSCQRLAEDASWQRMRTLVMTHLGINENDLFDLREVAFETLESNCDT
jgi:HD-like signal output (HDOD) protein